MDKNNIGPLEINNFSIFVKKILQIFFTFRYRNVHNLLIKYPGEPINLQRGVSHEPG